MDDKYAKVSEERSKVVDELISSKAEKKVIVAGPGTGKTFLFGKVLEPKKASLTLTFVNSLVEDLSLELCGLSEVRTLHGFARSILTKTTGKNINIYPKLGSIIKDDAKTLLDQEINFEWIFSQRDESNPELLEFYKRRRKYYQYYGFSDIIYTAVLYFEKDEDKIPAYSQVVVDEFQDFNKLEVDLINLLSKKSPVLLAGDDDQALYQFKGSCNRFIREIYNQTTEGYEPHNLPYCARCTRVIVDSTNDIIGCAKDLGLLDGRIDKPFIYFDDIEKDKTSEKYNKISYYQAFPTQVAWFIESKLAEIANELKSEFSVLIISPYKKQTIQVCRSLKSKGLQNIDYSLKGEEKFDVFDGIKILLEDKHSNLGWRIVSEYFIHPIEFQKLVKKSNEDSASAFEELIPAETKKQVKGHLSLFNYINKNKTINEDKLHSLISEYGINLNEIIIKYLKDTLNSSNSSHGIPEIRKIPIKATTIQSSKGLSADVVFITHFDDQYFIQDNDKATVTDQDICNFIVSITRAKQKLFLISTAKKDPTFLRWISKERIERLN